MKNKEKIIRPKEAHLKKPSPRLAPPEEPQIEEILIMNYNSNPKINGTNRSPWRKFVNQNKPATVVKKELNSISNKIDDFWNILEETDSQSHIKS